jgi:DNA-directed RNA polymerase subunit M/transcription elongation factor TFIIS
MNPKTKATVLGSLSDDKLVFFKNNYWGRCDHCDNLIWFAESKSPKTRFKLECPRCGICNRADRRKFKEGIFIKGTVTLTDKTRYDGSGHVFKAVQPFGNLPPVCFLEQGYEAHKKGNYNIAHLERSKLQWAAKKIYERYFFVCPKCGTSDIGLINKNTSKYWVCKYGHLFEWMGFEPEIAKPMK